MKKIECALRKGVTKENIVLENTTPINYLDKKELLDIAMGLDKTDPFAELVIDPKSYKERDYKMLNGLICEVGIPYDKNIHLDKNNPIYRHQHHAVLKFFRDFRGVGILADEVGMGKTIEAGMILSELAERKLVSSVLIVASSEENRDNWILELSDKFGLFIKDKNGRPDAYICKTEADILELTDGVRPTKPIIMDMESFISMNAKRLYGIVFDLIIMDEAHMLDESEMGRKGMNNLRVLMESKKKNNKPYCVLLSGTPHKGNLDSMFPLWYFMKSSSFKTEEEARKHYKEYLCHNTSTMSEFIEYFKERKLSNNTDYQIYKEEYLKRKYPNPKDEIKRSNLSKNDISIRNEFLNLFQNLELKNEIKEETRRSYFGLIDSFMIRQPRRSYQVGCERFAHNYYFLPLYDKSLINTKITVGNNDFYTNRSTYELTLNSMDFYGNDTLICDSKTMSIDAFLKSALINTKQDAKTIESEKNKIIHEFLTKGNIFTSGNVGTTEQYIISEDYYRNAFFNYDRQIDNNILPITESSRSDVIIKKSEKFVEIVNSKKHKNEQIITFFDYDEGDMNERDILLDYLYKNYPDIYDRVIVDSGSGLEASRFQDIDNSILFASYALSQSSNFQFCHTIINFSISKSPIIMDQKIGRIDRIGQQNDMDIYTFARMDKLDGYITALFNEIDIFSGWKDDIILVTGCDNKNTTLKICDDCQSVVRDPKGDLVCCEKCGGILNKIEIHENYKCSNQDCTYTFLRKTLYQDGVQNKSLGYAYACPKNVKLEYKKVNGKDYYVCPKDCVIDNCRRTDKKDCSLIYDKSINNTIIKRLSSCKNCDRKFCDSCSINVDVFGFNLKEEQVSGGCVNCESKPSCFFMFDKENPKCPICDSTLETMVPSTFDEFASYIWFQDHFVEDFMIETRKIKSVVETLGNREVRDDV